MRRRLLGWLAALSLTVSTGCDNVQWGGADLAIVPPPPKGTTATGTTVTLEGERIPNGPILYYVRLVGNGGTIVPIGEIAGDSLRPLRPTRSWENFGERFIAEFLRHGTEFALYHNGMRAGTYVVQGASVPDASVCPRLPVGTGSLELRSGADSATEFLALAKTQAPEVRNGIGGAIPPTRGMQVVGPILAERMLRARRAPLPGNWQRAMAQLKPFPLAGAADPGFAATFLVDDTLGPGFDDVGYSLFFVAIPQGQVGYDTAFVQFHPYERGGKAAPRVVDYLDWNRDGQVELLLQVFGTNQTWFEAVGQGGTRGWHRIFHDRCAPAPPTTPEPQPVATPEAGRAEPARPPAEAAPTGGTPAGSSPATAKQAAPQTRAAPQGRAAPAAGTPAAAAPPRPAPKPRQPPPLLGRPAPRDTAGGR